YDQVVHDIARQNLNVIFAIDRAGFVGPDGETHHGVFDIAYLRHVPNLVLLMPKDENELRRMMKTAVAYDAGPIAIRYPRTQGTGQELLELDELELLPIGCWETIREGDDLHILAVGPDMLALAAAAADQLAQLDIAVHIVNARSIKPLD